MGVWLLAGSVVVASGNATDRLVLRNLDVISDRTVTALDEDGLVLNGPRVGGRARVTWDEVERGRIALDQVRFDALLGELGLPLFRVRQRLKVGDYRGAGEAAETLYPRFAERKSRTAFLVCQATMWSRLAEGRREEAVEPYLRTYELLRTRAAASGDLPGTRRLALDAELGLTSELAPAWLDRASAKGALPGVERAIRMMAQPRPIGAYLYYATLGAAAEETGEVERMLPQLAAVEAFGNLVLAQQAAVDNAGVEIERLRQSQRTLPESCRPAVLYLLGKADVRSDNQETCRDGLLALMTLPATYGDEQRELAAAALYEASIGLDKLKDRAGAAAVRAELARRFSGTRYELKMRGEGQR